MVKPQQNSYPFYVPKINQQYQSTLASKPIEEKPMQKSMIGNANLPFTPTLAPKSISSHFEHKPTGFINHSYNVVSPPYRKS